ncbi:MAG TPA: hypothetical protein DHW82_00430 [Spirochaetia bacterium]|nr:MAG: hypothetical protein A2Y41_07200 [Spirochaetes bacterium GWB1_36_13]HCL55465.1 hypothetical protein [Spirochaetia bacterium]
MKDVILGKDLSFDPKKRVKLSNEDKLKEIEKRIKDERAKGSETSAYLNISMISVDGVKKTKRLKRLGRTECLDMKKLSAVLKLRKNEFFESGFLMLQICKRGTPFFTTILSGDEI